jgi:hypothetical protein
VALSHEEAGQFHDFLNDNEGILIFHFIAL